MSGAASGDGVTTLRGGAGVGWRAFFWVAAVYNLLVGVAGLLRPDAGPMERVVSLLVGCFGIVYALLAREPVRLAPVLWAGLVGKIGVIALLGPEVAAGTVPPATGFLLAGDALFAAGFLAFLLSVRSRR